MEVYRSCLAFMALVVTVTVAVPMISNSPYDAVLETVNKGKVTIKQQSGAFCKEIESGADKYACRISAHPEFGFLYCQEEIDENGVSCETIITDELKGLTTLKDAKIHTVGFYENKITGVQCPDTESFKCSGLIEEWVDESKGEFYQVRVRIDKDKVDKLIDEVISLTSNKADLLTTAADLKNIHNYMTTGSYRQICDLQGFFLTNGGFQISDTEGIEENLELDQRCKKGGPTTEDVLNALKKMIERFTTAAQKLVKN